MNPLQLTFNFCDEGYFLCHFIFVLVQKRYSYHKDLIKADLFGGNKY